MRINLSRLFNLLVWMFSVVRKIFAIEKENLPSKQKHRYVKNYIMPIIEKNGFDFTGDDVDRIINGLIWFLNRLAKKTGD